MALKPINILSEDSKRKGKNNDKQMRWVMEIERDGEREI
jgi:hypothetical protein